MYELTVNSSFSAAHYLRNYPGDCKRIHGHNYKVSVSIKAEHLNESGMIMDLMKLQNLLNQCISAMDHHFLNEIEWFEGVNPTSENIAKIIYDFMDKKIPKGVSMASVTIHEIDAFSVTYSRG